MKPNEPRKPLQRLLGSLKWALPLAAVIALIAYAFRPKPVEVDLGSVSRFAMQLTVDEDGETRVRERYIISAPLAGQLTRIALDPGDTVKAGDTLASITPGRSALLDPRSRAQAEAMLKAAEAGIASAATRLSAAKDDAEQVTKTYQRTKALHKDGTIADATFEASERAYLAAVHARESAEFGVKIARFEREQAHAALLHNTSENPPENSTFTIRAPVAGTVLRVHQESSRMLQTGTPLLEIGDTDQIEMRIDVLSQDAIGIKPGQLVNVEHWGGDTTLTGRVRHVEPSAYTKVSALGVDEQRVDIIADFEGDTALGDHYRIEASIVVWQADDVLQVPVGALFRHNGDWAVFLSEADRARFTTLQLGRNNGEYAEVLSGLKDADLVILHPGDRVEDSTLIQPRS